NSLSPPLQDIFMARSLSSWLRNVCSPAAVRRSARRRPLGLHLESLEDRVTPALHIDYTFGPTIQHDPHARDIEATIGKAVQILETYIANDITIHVTFQEAVRDLQNAPFEIKSSGFGYTPDVKVNILSDGGGSGATAKAIISPLGGFIDGI